MIDANHSRSYVNAQINRIKRMFKWAVAEELIPPSVSQGLVSCYGAANGPLVEPVKLIPILPVDDSVVDADLALYDLRSWPTWSAFSVSRVCGQPRSACSGLVISTALVTSGFTGQQPIRQSTMGDHGCVHLAPRLKRFCCGIWHAISRTTAFGPVTVKRKGGLRSHASRSDATELWQSPRHKPQDENRRGPPEHHYDTNSYRRAIH